MRNQVYFNVQSRPLDIWCYKTVLFHTGAFAGRSLLTFDSYPIPALYVEDLLPSLTRASYIQTRKKFL